MEETYGEVFLIVELNSAGGINDYIDECYALGSAMKEAIEYTKEGYPFENVAVIKATKFEVMCKLKCEEE